MRQLDTNHDGVLSRAEYSVVLPAAGGRSGVGGLGDLERCAAAHDP